MRFANDSYEVGRLNHHLGSSFTGTDLTGGPNYRMAPDYAGRAKLQ